MLTIRLPTSSLAIRAALAKAGRLFRVDSAIERPLSASVAIRPLLCLTGNPYRGTTTRKQTLNGCELPIEEGHCVFASALLTSAKTQTRPYRASSEPAAANLHQITQVSSRVTLVTAHRREVRR